MLGMLKLVAKGWTTNCVALPKKVLILLDIYRLYSTSILLLPICPKVAPQSAINDTLVHVVQFALVHWILQALYHLTLLCTLAHALETVSFVFVW